MSPQSSFRHISVKQARITSICNQVSAPRGTSTPQINAASAEPEYCKWANSKCRLLCMGVELGRSVTARMPAARMLLHFCICQWPRTQSLILLMSWRDQFAPPGIANFCCFSAPQHSHSSIAIRPIAHFSHPQPLRLQLITKSPKAICILRFKRPISSATPLTNLWSI